jgi:hypothetical protein
MNTYTETVNRFVVEYLEDLPEEHKAHYRLNGIDPDNNWQLKWSFTNVEAANEQCIDEEQWYKNFCEEHGYSVRKKFRVRDLGAPITIERSIFL